MKMKIDKGILLLALVLVVAVGMQPAGAASSKQGLGGALAVNGLQYLPNPATPGQYIDAWINVQNTKTGSSSVQCGLRPEYPFSIDSNENASRYIGTLNAGDNFVLKYKVRVDAAAVLGDNTLKIACKTEDTDWIEAKITISVQAQAKSLTIRSITVNPEEIAPGSEGTIDISLENLASAPLRDVSIKLDVSAEGLPFAPIGSATEQSASIIGGNEDVDFSFKVVTLASADPKAYKIPVKISYKDYLGNAYTINDTAGVIINAKPQVDAFVEQSSILRDNTGGKVVVKIVNSGLGGIKFLTVKANDSDAVRIAEPRYYYVGKLDSDDFETIEYTLFISNAGAKATLPLTLSYRDANNNEYTQQNAVEIRLYSQQEISQLGLEKGGTNWTLVAIVLLVGAFAVYWFWWRKRQKA